MTKLYIANCSKQEFDFTYMLFENPRPFMHKIRAGSQICLTVSDEEAKQIIDQHKVYGMQLADKATKGFSGLAYKLEKPISVEAIETGISQRDQEMIERALEARKNTAAATDSVLAQRAQEYGSRQTAPLEIEVIEEGKGPADSNTGNKFNETITVIKQGMGDAPKRGKSRKAA
jgi:hypothetical protein